MLALWLRPTVVSCAELRRSMCIGLAMSGEAASLARAQSPAHPPSGGRGALSLEQADSADYLVSNGHPGKVRSDGIVAGEWLR